MRNISLIIKGSNVLCQKKIKKMDLIHVKTFTKIIFIFSVLVFNDNEYKITDAAVNLFIQI